MKKAERVRVYLVEEKDKDPKGTVARNEQRDRGQIGRDRQRQREGCRVRRRKTRRKGWESMEKTNETLRCPPVAAPNGSIAGIGVASPASFGVLLLRSA